MDLSSIVFTKLNSEVLPVMQISKINVADIPDVDLSQLGVTKYDNFTVEVIDPVSDYLELMEVSHSTFSCLLVRTLCMKCHNFLCYLQNVFDFPLIKKLLSHPDFRYALTRKDDRLVVLLAS